MKKYKNCKAQLKVNCRIADLECNLKSTSEESTRDVVVAPPTFFILSGEDSNLGTFTRRKVKNSSGAPVPGVFVDIYDEEMEQVFSTTADSEGIYEVGPLKPGVYRYELFHSSFGMQSFTVEFNLPAQPDEV